MNKYIYELPDWPRFRWNDKALSPRLAALRLRQGRILGRMEGLGFSLCSEASFKTLTLDILNSSEIEGEILNPAQVRSSIARRLGMEIGALLPADRHVEGVVEMMLDATQNHAKPITRKRLFGWHASLFPSGYSGMGKIRTGAWRDDAKGPMRVISGPIGREWVHYEAPAAERIGDEMQVWVDWLNRDAGSDPVMKAAIAHLWFLTIHPFEDGNGRIARAVTDMLLARSDNTSQRFYSMSAQIRQERDAYYTILEKTQKGDLDISGWLTWFLDCLGRALEGTETLLESVFAKAKFWETHAGQRLNERQRLILNKLLDGFEGKLTSSKWAKIAKCSQDTALRDIQDLLNREILLKDPAGGRSTHYLLKASL
jgi:Fic family protein